MVQNSKAFLPVNLLPEVWLNGYERRKLLMRPAVGQRLVVAALLWALLAALGCRERRDGRAPPAARAAMEADFEPGGALLLACRDLVWHHPDLFAELIAAVESRLEVVALVPEPAFETVAAGALARRGVSPEAVSFITVPHETPWIRDYGPLFKLEYGEPALLDGGYALGRRPLDDHVPTALAAVAGAPLVRLPIDLPGGNLLHNGAGLCLTTTDLIRKNPRRGEKALRVLLREACGCDEVVFLEPLAGERTAHADIFAAFIDSDTIVVGRYDPRVDPRNALILDRNARALAALRLPGRRLRVRRIPMPPHEANAWRTYTNVIFANGLLLVPHYPGIDPAGFEEAVRIYSELLEGWEVRGIDCSGLARLHAGLRCITVRLPQSLLERWRPAERS
jgi:agmatine/peptidylarginine deiminase